METLRRIHFVGIGGTGMGSLAGLLHARGLAVTGSDSQLYPPMSTALEHWGIPVADGFRPEHVLQARPDLVVIGNAIRPDNPEARAAIDEGLSYLSFPDALYQLAMAGKHSVVVSGTHGKTTTTSLTASLLLRTGCDPSVLIGGYALDFDGSFREGSGEHFVVEGDEYDTAFFDKTPKFLHYGARTLILTSIEFDHADIYRDLDHVADAFRTLISRLPADGTLVAALDHELVADVASEAPCRVVGYGLSEACDLRATSLESDAEGTHFSVRRDGAELGRARVSLHGEFNVCNALAALATVDALGVPAPAALEALAQFRGVKRRQEVYGEARGITIIDDFAHHPTAVRASIGALRARYPGRKLVAVLEPRTNTSRRQIFQSDYAAAFDGADRVIIARVPDTPIYSATGEVGERLSADRLASDLQGRGLAAEAFEGVDAILADLRETCASGDVILCMSNGDFGGILPRLLEALRG